MKKTYISPSVEIENVDLYEMIALSVEVDPGTGDGNDITTKGENEDWNIWNED